MRRHAMLLSLVGVLLLTLSVPAVAKPGKGGPPDPGPYDLPPCGVKTGTGSFPFIEACEWLPPEKGRYTISARSERAIRNLGLTLRDSVPGNWCAIAWTEDRYTVSLTYEFAKVAGTDQGTGTFQDTCDIAEGEPDWPDDDEEFVIGIAGTHKTDGITITITGPTP